jgi:L-rhamnose isomerase
VSLASVSRREQGARATFRIYCWPCGELWRGMDEIELQIHCLKTKVDNLKVRVPNWASSNSSGTKLAILPKKTWSF